MIEQLARIVGSDHVLEARGAYLSDATTVLGAGHADAVVRPGSADEVAAVVAWCYAHDVPVVPRGGGTGLAGGAIPQGGVVLALERLRAVRELAPLEWRMCVEAGLPTAEVQRLARENGTYYAPDPGAAEQSQIGGNVATNAGGPHCLKYGVTRAWVTGVEAVLAPGELVAFGGPVRKDVAGYDLAGLLCGSEGTLGIITAVHLKLLPAPAGAWPVVADYPDAAGAAEALERLRACGSVPAAAEFLDAATMAAAGGDERFLVIAESDVSAEEAERFAEALGPHARPRDPAELWRWRAGISIAVEGARGAKLSEDVAVPVERLADAVEGVQAIGARHGVPACTWGHAGDGNLHATFLLAPGERADAAAEDVFALALELGGTVSGEHGLGRLKAGQLRRQWDPAAVAAHAAVKRALDPKGLLNPGVKTA